MNIRTFFLFKALGSLVVITLVFGFFFFFKREPHNYEQREPATEINTEPTTFSHQGVVTFTKSAGQLSAPSFTYKDAAGNIATTTFTFDALSACAFQSGSTPCMAMSITLDKPFGNKAAVVEGVREGESILVRKLYGLEVSEPVRVPSTQSIFISWPQAVGFINSCAPTLVMQTHTLDVYLTFKDGSHLKTVEPLMDEVFKVVESARAMCGSIPVATE